MHRQQKKKKKALCHNRGDQVELSWPLQMKYGISYSSNINKLLFYQTICIIMGYVVTQVICLIDTSVQSSTVVVLFVLHIKSITFSSSETENGWRLNQGILIFF